MSLDNYNCGLRSYAEEYYYITKQIHKQMSDNEIIRNLSVNLPSNILLQFNRNSLSWMEIESFENFSRLVGHLETSILPFEKAGSAPNEELIKTMNQVKEALQVLKESKATNEDKKSLETEAVASAWLKTMRQRLGTTGTTVHNSLIGNKAADIDTLDIKAIRTFSQVPIIVIIGYATTDSISRIGSTITIGNQLVVIKQQHALTRLKPKINQSLVDAYTDKFGEIPSPCYHCNGHHFNEHCSLNNLNELRTPGKEAPGRP